jgi:uncharacterized phage protein (TIGR02216 family)
MGAGLGALRLAPSAFWAMTPRELAAALGIGLAGRTAPGRGDLAALMRRYPDGPDSAPGFDDIQPS